MLIRVAKSNANSISVPFTSGRSFLSAPQVLQSLTLTNFSPLHIGAVISFAQPGACPMTSLPISVPFTSGRSFLCAPDLGRRTDRTDFSPLHIGAVISLSPLCRAPAAAFYFSPLHIGAVISLSVDRIRERVDLDFSPLHIGAVISFRNGFQFGRARFAISVPFTSGRSFLCLARAPTCRAHFDFSPLHIGAVISLQLRTVA